ncbi:hypothetical protein PHPALM_28325 [Phytophthora palmivora]|uniref:Uncharacterized protein n=1 Tax=Phytophthora palmivora TaxID=4796 RepID=A0A2P4XAE4_9STRA|nr:hypothetical protein PHPALM_28325 [Phytophthora palmivora]
MGSLQTTSAETNKLLLERHHGVIDESVVLEMQRITTSTMIYRATYSKIFKREWCISPGTVNTSLTQIQLKLEDEGAELSLSLAAQRFCQDSRSWKVNKATLKRSTQILVKCNCFRTSPIEFATEVVFRGYGEDYNRMNRTKIYALCWNDQNPKVITSNRGITLPGSDCVRVRRRCVIENG